VLDDHREQVAVKDEEGGREREREGGREREKEKKRGSGEKGGRWLWDRMCPGGKREEYNRGETRSAKYETVANSRSVRLSKKTASGAKRTLDLVGRSPASSFPLRSQSLCKAKWL